MAEPGFARGPTLSSCHSNPPAPGTKDRSFGTKLLHLVKIRGQGSGGRQIQFWAQGCVLSPSQGWAGDLPMKTLFAEPALASRAGAEMEGTEIHLLITGLTCRGAGSTEPGRGTLLTTSAAVVLAFISSVPLGTLRRTEPGCQRCDV